MTNENETPVWEQSMNAAQLEAIRHHEGPVRVFAPAGSGKTRVIVHRVARMVASGVEPSRILAVTFSKKAADEMAHRIDQLGVSGARVATWHSLCLQILKRDRTRYADWEIDKGSRAKLVLKDVVGWKGMKWNGADVNALSQLIAVCKANMLAPSSEGALAIAKKTFFGSLSMKAMEAFQKYDEALAEKELLTFDDMLLFAARHLDDDDARERWAAFWDFVIQDEAQDESLVQKHIARRLAEGHQNYMAVGDPFQAIYSWRGSSPTHLATFDLEWPGSTTIWLGENYRSGSEIIEAANRVVALAKIPNIEPRMMVAARSVVGSVRVESCEDLDDEAKHFSSWTKGIIDNGEKPSSIVALFRTNAQSRALEEALLKARLPYALVGGVGFYERKEVRDLLAYLRVASDRGGEELSAFSGRRQQRSAIDDVKRCINAPFRFLGARFVERVQEAAGVPGLLDRGWMQLVLDVADADSTAQQWQKERQRQSAGEWASIIESVKVQMGSSDPDKRKASSVLDAIVKATRYVDWIAKEEGEDTIETSACANVRELLRVAERFPTVVELLDYIDATMRAAYDQKETKQAGGNRVLLMSIHRGKGLEWNHVWVVGLNEMILPHGRGDPEEERRLAYVAMTRARDTLVLSHVRTMATRVGVRDAQPSRFLADVKKKIDDE